MEEINGREFVRMLKHEVMDATVHSVLKSLSSPRSPRPVPTSPDPIQRSMAEFFNRGAERQQQRAAWFRSLSPEQQGMLSSLLEECAEMSTLSFCTLIDGVGGPWDGAFEIWAVDAHDRKTLLNPQNSDMMHDLLSDICEEERHS